jgi:iron(III) transport system permease protein
MQTAGWDRLKQLRPDSRTIVLTAASVAFLLICASPAIYMFASSFVSKDGGFTLANYSRIIAEPRQRSLLLSSATLGIGAALLATAIGAPLGILLARSDVPFRRIVRILLSVPLVIPPYVLALSWILLTSPSGVLARILGRDVLSSYTYNSFAAALVLGIAFYPIAMLATEAAARRVNGRLEEAGLLVIPHRSVFFRITLRLVSPTIVASALIVFVLSISEFGVPGLLRVRVFTTEVFTAFAALYDFGAATALALPLLILVLCAALAAKAIIGDQLVSTSRTASEGIPLHLGNFRSVTFVLVVLLLLACVFLPLSTLMIETRGLHQIAGAFALSGSAIRNSLLLSAVGAIAITSLGLLLGYQRSHSHSWLAKVQDILFILLFAVPSTVIGVGIIGLWNRPGIPAQLYASNLPVLVAYMARFVPVAALMLSASNRHIPASSEEAARLAGARSPRSFASIVVPQMRAGIAASFVVVFIFVFGELGATVLVAPPGESTLPVRVYTLIANAPASDVAALALIQSAIVLLPMGILGLSAHMQGEGKQT